MSRSATLTLTSPGPLRLYSTKELLTLPPPKWLIENIIPEGGLAGLYGPPESTKSFVAIDLALCVATGMSWHGHAVQSGFVLYVAAEGGPGIGKRVRAWLAAHGDMKPTQPTIAWLIESLSITKNSDDVEILMARLDEEMVKVPKLIVVDTLARCFDGDENQQEDMGRFVAGLDRFRHEYGATLLAIHHTRLDGERERGNTALRGGTDTMMSITRDEHGEIVLECTKQKDAEHFPPMAFRLEPVLKADSCVVLRTDHARKQEKALKTQRILDILHEHGPLSWDQCLSASELPRGTFHRYLVELAKSRKIIKENGLWRLNIENG